MTLRVGTFCSGIAAPELAWSPLGWQPQWFSEIDPFASAVLAHHYSGVPNLGDMEAIRGEDLRGTVDVVCAGTPCQSFSVAGLRGGMADARGNLALVFLGLVDAIRPRWVVWENVPGVLSSNEGRDFGSFVGALGQLGYGWAYRVLDAQYYGVPQRRRRVFVVGHSGDWRGAAAVLFERDCLRGNPAPGGSTRERIADAAISRALTSSHTATGRLDPNETTFIPIDMRQASRGATMTNNRGDDACSGGAPGTGIGEPGDPAPSISMSHPPAVAFDWQSGGDVRLNIADRTSALQACQTPAVAVQEDNQNGVALRDTAGSLRSDAPGTQPCGTLAFHPSGMTVRRLTPRECERLQGFPDDYTLIRCRGKPAADGPRYRALGNSMAVPVLRWIGERIEQVEAAALTPTGRGRAEA
jgi:DNA (cytosine-5)-methyltransferase 1